MSDNLVHALVAVVVAIIGLASLAVILSGGGQAAGTVLNAGGQSLSGTIRAAVSPVTGGSSGFQLPTLNSGWQGGSGGGY